MIRRALVLLVSMVGAAAPAFAQNTVRPTAIELYPTFEAIGVRASYTGDDNQNATAYLEWRLDGAASWTRGVNLTRISNRRWAGSVMWLVPDRPYEVRAVINDPDGGSGSVTGTVDTRRVPSEVAVGRTWWVAPNGNDANNGSEGSPLRTPQAAIGRAQAGDEVRIRPGIYYTSLSTSRAGTANALIHLVADAPGVVLDGSDPAYLQRNDWRDESGGVFSVAYGGATRLVAADSLQRLYRQASVSALRSNANGVSQGWVTENGRLFVKLEDGSSPNGHTMHVARYDNGVYVEHDYWRISGIEVRFYGVSAAGAGIYLRGASNCVVSENHVHTIGGRGIFLRELAANNLIEGNLVRDPRISTWPWSATKAHEEEKQGISQRGGRGNVIRFNHVAGTFDGIDLSGGETDENVGADTDFNDNFVSNTRDDGLEPEAVSGINVRLWRNHVDACYSAMSIAPATQGPIYVLYNTFTNTERGALKFSIGSTAVVWLCHNTIYSSRSGSAAVHPTGNYSNLQFRNNIMVGNGAAAVSDDAGESLDGNTFDGDLLHSNTSSLFRWKGVNYSTISALRSATGFEINGRAGDPMFDSVGAGDYTLRAGSPAIDVAIRLPGINDRFGGLGPDIGAWEFNALDLVAPSMITDLRTEPAP